MHVGKSENVFHYSAEVCVAIAALVHRDCNHNVRIVASSPSFKINSLFSHSSRFLVEQMITVG